MAARLLSVAFIVSSLGGAVLAVDPLGLVMLQVHAGSFNSIDNGPCGIPFQKWYSKRMFLNFLDEDLIEDMINMSLIESRPSPENPKTVEYGFKAAPRKLWYLAADFEANYTSEFISRMIKEDRLVVMQKPDCPKWARYYKWKKEYMSEEVLHSLYGNETIRGFNRDGILEMRRNPEHKERKQFRILYDQVKDKLKAKKINDEGTVAIVDEMINGLEDADLANEHDLEATFSENAAEKAHVFSAKREEAAMQSDASVAPENMKRCTYFCQSLSQQRWFVKQSLLRFIDEPLIDTMVEKGIVLQRSSPHNPTVSQYSFRAAPRKLWYSKKDLQANYSQEFIDRMIAEEKLVTVKRDYCPEWSRCYKWAKEYMSENVLRSLYDEKTIRAFEKEGILESRPNPEDKERTQYRILYDKIKTSLKGSDVVGTQTEALADTMTDALQDEALQDEHDLYVEDEVGSFDVETSRDSPFQGDEQNVLQAPEEDDIATKQVLEDDVPAPEPEKVETPAESAEPAEEAAAEPSVQPDAQQEEEPADHEKPADSTHCHAWECSCEGAAREFGIETGETWGTATMDAKVWWVIQKCGRR